MNGSLHKVSFPSLEVFKQRLSGKGKWFSSGILDLKGCSGLSVVDHYAYLRRQMQPKKVLKNILYLVCLLNVCTYSAHVVYRDLLKIFVMKVTSF